MLLHQKSKPWAILIVLLVVCFPLTLCAMSPFERLLKPLEGLKSAKLSETRIADGLREALRVGIDNAVNATGKVDGFFGNEAIKIAMPEKVQMIEKGLRVIGLGPKIDDFILSMNRAAEGAVPYARDIFIDAIMDMSFDDAMAVYKGGDTAATDFFKAKTHDKLVAAFLPQARKALDNYDVTKKYRELTGLYQKLPFADKLPAFDVEEYVVSKTIDGLFSVLAEEEKKIRTQPSARVTDVLKEVFK
ncbi:MAG: DUF4197 domain-containing protein [Candidatus Auribacter fodinae]|uniref:DUF4197 domain-containing protein n=1 Tax=Candidatus Auribacter fodinae TaxID=2093366 RepID=A0A3A4QPU7_9BACT|nr:MAG: DUF4197 domain-containing protein [Candidatus Auribacter fodinae]